MSIELKSVEDSINDNGIKILVHGPAGSGKTVLATTTGSTTIIINAESGLLSLRPILRKHPGMNEKIRIITVLTWDDLEDAYKYLKEEHRCDWIVLDSISEIAETVLSEEKKNSTDPRKAYMKMQNDIESLLRGFRDLPNYHVYMSCKQELKPDQYTGVNRYRPGMPGQNLPQSIPYIFDEVFALRCEQNEDGELERMLQTSRDIQYDGKDRSGCLDMFEPPDLLHILEKIESGIPVTLGTEKLELVSESNQPAEQA